MFTARNIRYEISNRSRGIAHGGIGALHVLARQLGLIDAIDDRLHLLKIHLPFHESDHVLNFAYNALCDGCPYRKCRIDGHSPYGQNSPPSRRQAANGAQNDRRRECRLNGFG